LQPVPLDPERVLIGVRAADRAALLHQMATAMLNAPGLDAGLTVEKIIQATEEREIGRSTQFGKGFALPHARLPGVKGPRICVATLAEPVDYNGEPVSLVILLIGPQERPGIMLQTLSAIARLIRDPKTRDVIERANDAVTLSAWLTAHLQEEDGLITAVDVMRPSLGRVRPDTPVPSLVRSMAALNLDAAGITDDAGKLVGQITADDLFTLGMPDFFRQLKSVAFIAEFDPFEKYFEREATLTVADVMTPPVAIVAPAATILEIVFMLSVKGHPKVYVVNERNHLLGVIDRIRVLDRIFDL
jgi:PTS system nitrogen regulatory IIA component